MDWIAGLTTTGAGFDMIQNHVDLLTGKVHAVPARATATAADAAAIIRDMCLRSGDGFPDVLVVDHESKFTNEVFRAFFKGCCSCLIVGSAYHKNANANVERANGVAATHVAPSPTAARTTETATCRLPCSPSTTRRRLAATRRPSSSTAALTLGPRCRRLAMKSLLVRHLHL